MFPWPELICLSTKQGETLDEEDLAFITHLRILGFASLKGRNIKLFLFWVFHLAQLILILQFNYTEYKYNNTNDYSLKGINGIFYLSLITWHKQYGRKGPSLCCTVLCINYNLF